MDSILDINPNWRLASLFVLGTVLGGQINRGIYRLAWSPRAIGPWSKPHADAAPRHWFDYLPVAGWLTLRRESRLHGSAYWLRPLSLEILAGVGLAGLYWWEVLSDGLAPAGPWQSRSMPQLHSQFLSHALLLCLMTVATFIDFDEKTIPDTITVPGTLWGLFLAAILPASPLPVPHPDTGQIVTLLTTTPYSWSNWLDSPRGLLLGLGIYTCWCVALAPKTWTLRYGWKRACTLLLASMLKDGRYRIPLGLLVSGLASISLAWQVLEQGWPTLFSALVGLAFGGGLVWSVRIIAGVVLGKEAMGFGDVTLMSMIGAFLGWQTGLLTFFLAPGAAALISIGQWLLTRNREIAFGPYLCLSASILLVSWRWVWATTGKYFDLGWYIPLLILISLVLMSVFLGGWRLIENFLFYPGDSR